MSIRGCSLEQVGVYVLGHFACCLKDKETAMELCFKAGGGDLKRANKRNARLDYRFSSSQDNDKGSPMKKRRHTQSQRSQGIPRASSRLQQTSTTVSEIRAEK